MSIKRHLKTGEEFTKLGAAAVIAPNLAWGLCDVLIAIIGRGMVVTWVHGVTGGIFALLLFPIIKQKFVLKDFLNAFPIGVQRAVTWSILFLAFQEDNPSIAITIMSFSIIVSIVVFGPRLGEPVTVKVVVISLIGVVGVIATSLADIGSFELSRGAILALLILPLSAAGTFVLRNVQKKVPARTASLYMYMWIGILLTPVIGFTNPQFGFTNHEYLVIIMMMVLGVGGHVLFSLSQPRTTFRFNAIASLIHIPATAIFSWWLLDSILKPHQIIGMAIVSAVVLYVSIQARKPEIQELVENSEQQQQA